MEELKLEKGGHEDEERKRAEADRETAADRWVYFGPNFYYAILYVVLPDQKLNYELEVLAPRITICGFFRGE